jgi:hypothetical protein
MWNCPLLRRNTQVLLVETKFLSLQNTRGATSGGGTVHSSEVTRRVLLVEEELLPL